jgi:hypothetical protein
MIILGLLLEVMDLSGADLDNVTRPRLPANAAVDDRQRSILHLPHAAELLRYQRHAGRAQHSLYGAALSFTRTHFRASVVTYDDPIFSPRERGHRSCVPDSEILIAVVEDRIRALDVLFLQIAEPFGERLELAFQIQIFEPLGRPNSCAGIVGAVMAYSVKYWT